VEARHRLATILPAMTLAEAIETTRVHSVAGLTDGHTVLVTTRPFRAPPQTISDVGLTGGGRVPTPGEVSLAHHGILFLDALPELQNPPGVTGSNGVVHRLHRSTRRSPHHAMCRPHHARMAHLRQQPRRSARIAEHTMHHLTPYTGAPVVVIGNGPVGETASLLLARWGIPVVVLDGRPARDLVGSKAICQQRDVLDVWEAVGVGRQLADEGVTWSTARTYYQARELFSITLADPGQSPFPPFVNISQARTEEVLADKMADNPLIEQRWGHEVTAISQDGSGVRLTCRTIHGAVAVRAPYVVMAAGPHAGALRRQLGVGFPGRSYDDRFLICDIRAELPGWERERRFYFDPPWNPGRQVLIHPTPGSVFRIDWQVPADVDLDAEERSGALDARIRAIVGLDAAYAIVWKSIYTFHGRRAERMKAGRVLLAGDCAHLMAPFGARGLNSGVHDAENAAWKLAFVLRGWAPQALLQTYDGERMAAAAENLEVTEATMRFLVPQHAAERAHRLDILERALHDPEAWSQVDSGRMYEPFWYVDSPLTTPSTGRPFPGRPARGQLPPPLPGVIVPDTPITDPARPEASRLRDIARDGLLLLVADDVAQDDAQAFAARLTAAPVRTVALGTLTPDGRLAAILGAQPGEAWVVRPDGHIAAVVPAARRATLAGAIRRVLGSPVPVNAS
jgi:3-(3-hydroxy-phenyl)propionate hydroxylase